MSTQPNGINTPSRRILATIARLTGRALSEKGTARLAALVAPPAPKLSPAEEFFALMPIVRDTLDAESKQAHADWLRVDTLGYPVSMVMAKRKRWNEKVNALETAELILKSPEWAVDRVLDYAASRSFDPCQFPLLAVEGWALSGRVAPERCLECNSVMVHVDAEPADPSVGLGAIDAGLVCSNCEIDKRHHHPAVGRGSDAPFLG